MFRSARRCWRLLRKLTAGPFVLSFRMMHVGKACLLLYGKRPTSRRVRMRLPSGHPVGVCWPLCTPGKVAGWPSASSGSSLSSSRAGMNDYGVAVSSNPPTCGFNSRNLRAPCGCKSQVRALLLLHRLGSQRFHDASRLCLMQSEDDADCKHGKRDSKRCDDIGPRQRECERGERVAHAVVDCVRSERC